MISEEPLNSPDSDLYRKYSKNRQLKFVEKKRKIKSNNDEYRKKVKK